MTDEELDELMHGAIDDPRLEPVFFRALLDATVYAHVPRSDDTGRLRFTMFARPDNGEIVLPFFTHESLADECVGNERRVVSLPGRTLLEHTRGATLILNPNDQQYVFYPEEVSLFLDVGVIAPRKVEGVRLDADTRISPLGSKPGWLGRLAGIFRRLPYVDVAYAAGATLASEPDRPAILITLGVEPAYAERAVRTVLAIIAARAKHIGVAVGVSTFDPKQGIPRSLRSQGIEPFYLLNAEAAGQR